MGAGKGLKPDFLTGASSLYFKLLYETLDFELRGVWKASVPVTDTQFTISMSSISMSNLKEGYDFALSMAARIEKN